MKQDAWLRFGIRHSRDVSTNRTHDLVTSALRKRLEKTESRLRDLAEAQAREQAQVLALEQAIERAKTLVKVGEVGGLRHKSVVERLRDLFAACEDIGLSSAEVSDILKNVPPETVRTGLKRLVANNYLRYDAGFYVLNKRPQSEGG